jgi:hypothetical protein
MSIRKHKNDRFKIVHGEVTRKVYAKQKADKRNSKPKKIASEATKDRKLKIKEVKRGKFLLKQKGKEVISNLSHKNAVS